MSRLIPRKGVGILALVGALLVLPAGSAMADGGSATHPFFTFTFKAKHGWHMTVSAYLCGSKNSGVSVGATKTGSHYTFNHYYSGPARKAGCTGSRTLSGGKMHAHWGRLFSLKMSIKSTGAKTVMPTPKGCTGVAGHQRPVKATGTLRVRIHKGVLGSLYKTKLKGIAELFDQSKNFKCTGGGNVPKATYASGLFGANFLSAVKYDKTGNTFLNISGNDKLSSTVFGGFGDSFTGAPFTFSKDLTSATVGSITPFLSGSLKFSGSSSPSPGCEDGSWNSGTLKVHDGLSKATLVGSTSVFGTLDKSTGNCTG